MKKLLKTTVAFALTCGIAGAIGIEWSTTALNLGESSGSLATTAGETPNYGTSLDQFVLQLVFIGDGTMTGGKYETLDAIQTGTIVSIPSVPESEQPGVVQGVANVSQAGTYMMLLYNNHGGYYALSSTFEGSQIASSSVTVTAEDIDLGIGVKGMDVTGDTFRGALVPEPSTAALALAGIALLFRRKRA